MKMFRDGYPQKFKPSRYNKLFYILYIQHSYTSMHSLAMVTVLVEYIDIIKFASWLYIIVTIMVFDTMELHHNDYSPSEVPNGRHCSLY